MGMVSDFEFKVGSSYKNRMGTYVVKEIREDTIFVQYTDGETAELVTSLQKKTILNMQEQSSGQVDELIDRSLNKVDSTLRAMLKNSRGPSVGSQCSTINNQRTNWTTEEDKIVKRLISEGKLRALYYMADIHHIPSILLTGIYSRNHATANNLIQKDHSDQAVQERRHYGLIPGTRLSIHDCVPLYFTYETPMRAVYLFGSDPRMNMNDLALIEVKPEKLFREVRIIITDGNAAAFKTSFFKKIIDLDRLNWEAICCRGYNENEAIKKGRQSEVLVPNHIPVKFFNRVAVYCENTKKLIEAEYKKVVHSEMDNGRAVECIPIDIVRDYYWR
jgi:hypothetical protein